MSDKKQTPIDYIRDNLFYPIQLNQLKRVLNEAEQMHKEQIEKAWHDGDAYQYSTSQTGEEYYNKNYGK
jgi:hypothetical protein